MTEPSKDESPFERPKIMDGYPLSPNEARALTGYPGQVEMETVRIPSRFKPRWWQFRLRYRMRRFRRDAAKQEERLIALIGEEMYNKMQSELERQILIGPGDGE